MRRLRLMVKKGYIKVIDFLENGENVYCITRKSCKELNLEYSAIKKTDKLNHHLACVDFYYSIKNKSPTVIKLENQYYFKHFDKRYSFRPDLLIQIDRWYLVEIDLCNRRFEDKVDAWETFLKSGEFKKHFDKYPPIIIVSTDVDKVQKIIEKHKSVNLNYVFKDYNEVKEWDYVYLSKSQ